jgi:hypothetical protein
MLVECDLGEVVLEMAYVTSRTCENKMKQLWLAVFLMVTATVFYGNEDKQFDSTTTRKPTVRVTDGGLETVIHREPSCTAVDAFFAEEVWGKVGERTCLKCHNAKGDAAESEFVLQETLQDHTALEKNRQTFLRHAIAQEDGMSRLLLKVAGELEHGGGEVLKNDSTGYKILSQFVRRSTGKPIVFPSPAELNLKPFFVGVQMMTPGRLLRRVTLSLAGRLPTPVEQTDVRKGGLKALDTILVRIMKEEAFYELLQEAFNDILLIRGYDGVAETALSYEHFNHRNWYQKHDLSSVGNEDAQREARYKLVRDYREAMLREPLELIKYIVRNERPFTDILTADYIMVTPYTSRGYGIYQDLKDKFKNPDDPFEYIPTQLPSLKHRDGRSHQESPTGFYPHAGVLSTFQYLKRYPTTETNRNRLRVRMYFEHFLGVDIMALAPRVNDAAKITTEYEIPTMEAADCVVCHKVIDPVAGLFQDYYAVDGKGIFGPRENGWYKDMFGPGLYGEDLPAEDRWRSLQWLGEWTVKDPRFAVAMVKHVWYILYGRKPLLPPEDIDDPLFSVKRRSYLVQCNEIEQIATRFTQAKFNLKVIFRELVLSKFYRVDGLNISTTDPNRLAELDDLGLIHMLSPEQLERKLTAIFGRKWGRLTHRESNFKILYGGIDSKAVTTRITEPSGAMGAIQRIMANDVACKNVAADFSLPAKERRLFPTIEPSVIPALNAESDQQIKYAIIHLHHLILGRDDTAEDPEVQRTFDLFAGIISDARSQDKFDPRETYACQSLREQTPRDPDPEYTIRAWRGVVTYLLRQLDFLYE